MGSIPSIRPAASPTSAGSIASPLSWETFLKNDVSQKIENMKPRYAAEFQNFWWQHSPLWQDPALKIQVEEKFYKARALFDILKSGGLWGFCFHLDGEEVWSVPSLLATLARNASQKEGAESDCLLQGDCDKVDFLFAVLGTLLGLDDIAVHLVQDNHVNVFVPLGGGVALRMDPSGVSNGLYETPWNIPEAHYQPEGKGPEKYNAGMLLPFNRNVKNLALQFAKGRLDPQGKENLLARLEPTHDASILVPQKWTPFVRGYQNTEKCYERFMKRHSYATVEEAAAAYHDPIAGELQASDELSYLSCVDNPKDSSWIKLGAVIGYFAVSGCAPSPQSLGFLGCQMATLNFRDALTHYEMTYHPTDKSAVEGETMTLAEEMKVLEKMDIEPFHLPDQNANLGAWILWMNNGLVKDPAASRAVAALAHALKYHMAETQWGAR